MKQYACMLTWGLILLAFSACRREPADETPVSIAFHTRLVSNEAQAGNGTARLLFWSDEDFHNDWIIDQSSAVQPRYTVQLNQDINHYNYESRIYYQTPYTYPLNFGKIHATGYAPDHVLRPVAGKGYTQLAVDPSYQNGSVDLLTCDGCLAHSASMNDNNTFLRKEKELQFRHLTAKITFFGSREEDMHGLVGVRNIKIRLHNSDTGLVVPVRLALYTNAYRRPDGDPSGYSEDTSTYIVAETKVYENADPLSHPTLIPMHETVTLGSYYLLSEGIAYGREGEVFDPIRGEWAGRLSGEPELGFTVEAELYNADEASGADAYTTEEWVVNKVAWSKDKVKTGDKFLPGYEYQIHIRFNRVGIALRADQVPWNSEEMHEYPIYPSLPDAEK